MRLEDNIVDGPWVRWNPPYHVLLIQKVLGDAKNSVIVEIYNDPVTAFDALKIHEENDQKTYPVKWREWAILDSFNEDVTNFCKYRYDVYMASRTANPKGTAKKT